ncbi:MAG: Gfo/Idh/MocA family oxidoreductase [Victivallales bacterium]|jgi:predicted dehydrogenase
MINESKLRVAQVGVGGFGRRRRESMRRTGLFELVAAYDWNQEALAECEKEDGAKPVANYEELISTPGIEAVIISSGAKYHAEQMLVAMNLGLHVFVEKPLCSTKSELKTIISAIKKSGVVVGMGHHDHRSNARSSTVRQMIERGDFGSIASFEATTAHSGGLEIKPGDWRGDPEKNPGGMLFHCGTHLMHELMFYFGPVAEVYSSMRYDLHPTQTSDVAHCILTFSSGVTGVLSAYHVTPYRSTLNIYGTKMNLYFEAGGYGIPDKIVTQLRKVGCELEPQIPLTLDQIGDPDGNIRSFYETIKGRGKPSPSLADGVRAVEIVFAAEESSRIHRPVKIQFSL